MQTNSTTSSCPGCWATTIDARERELKQRPSLVPAMFQEWSRHAGYFATLAIGAQYDPEPGIEFEPDWQRFMDLSDLLACWLQRRSVPEAIALMELGYHVVPAAEGAVDHAYPWEVNDDRIDVLMHRCLAIERMAELLAYQELFAEGRESPSDLIPVRRAAEIAASAKRAKSESQIRRWIHERRLPAYGDGPLLVSESEFRDLLPTLDRRNHAHPTRRRA